MTTQEVGKTLRHAMSENNAGSLGDYAAQAAVFDLASTWDQYGTDVDPKLVVSDLNDVIASIEAVEAAVARAVGVNS